MLDGTILSVTLCALSSFAKQGRVELCLLGCIGSYSITRNFAKEGLGWLVMSQQELISQKRDAIIYLVYSHARYRFVGFAAWRVAWGSVLCIATYLYSYIAVVRSRIFVETHLRKLRGILHTRYIYILTYQVLLIRMTL